MRLTVERLSVFYDDIRALDKVSLRVDPSEVVSLIGSNGAGKTTFLKTLCGLLRPRQGSIRLDGEELTTLSPHRIVEKGMALVPEGRKLWPRMTVRENLDLGAYPARARRHRAESLERVFAFFPCLRERHRQLAGTLSGGEQQMTAIARGLMSCPRLLLLDEPSLGLAPVAAEEVFQVVRQISRDGVAILLVEQNLHQALALSRRAYVLETGRVKKEGASEALLADPSIRSAYLGL
ncbi:MAG: ABC transporter ATP-binding protein [Acidobacteriota bacterium]